MPHELRQQRKRTKGWKKPEGAVCVDRTNRRYGNPYQIGQPHPETGQPMTREDVLQLFREHAALHFTAADLEQLRGKVLLCWCKPDEGCHADILCELANGG